MCDRYGMRGKMEDKNSRLSSTVAATIRTQYAKLVKKVEEHERHLNVLWKQREILHKQIKAHCEKQEEKRDGENNPFDFYR